ncbi:hypothetical protein V1282_002906 [Nitrobacteraceae bacterium AZCC 2146]
MGVNPLMNYLLEVGPPLLGSGWHIGPLGDRANYCVQVGGLCT